MYKSQDQMCCSLVVETIPQHKDFSNRDPEYKNIRRVSYLHSRQTDVLR